MAVNILFLTNNYRVGLLKAADSRLIKWWIVKLPR